MADPYDFQIESMKFRMAVTDKTPYVRTTAPFRKEQFDSSPTVGDQSLTGWWTRGQLSFHKGEGLNYYEVLEGEEVLNRFKSSEHVEVFEPGEVTLAIEPIDLDSTVAGEGIAEAVAYRSSNLVALTQYGNTYYFPSATSTPTLVAQNDATDARQICTLGSDWYAGTSGKKIEKYTAGTYQSTLYSHTETIYRLWGGKSRLWIVDALRDLYVVTADPSGALPIALASPVCRFDIGYTTQFSFTEGGGAVFVSAGRREIYSFTPDADGSIATLAAPVTAAIMPESEYVQCIRAHMGLLCIVTTAGVRFALIDGANLTVGPLNVEWTDSYARQLGIIGSTIYVTGEDPDTSTLCYAFDLSQPLPSSPLLFPRQNAWFGVQSAYVNGAWTGSVEYARSRRVFWGGDSSFSTRTYFQSDYGQSNLYSSGYVTTGYHRFGTLDNKRFQKVIVRAKGSGTIQVYRVDADETETSLGTMNAADEVATFDLSMSSAVERIALKFVLNRDSIDATQGPTLLGYQIKALPVPERQRLLKVPLQLQDELTLRRGTRVGKRGKAYTDIDALETLEKNQAVVTFTDHRTGETGTAYIDQVDFQGETPSSQNTNGFGGIAYVTLRVLS